MKDQRPERRRKTKKERMQLQQILLFSMMNLRQKINFRITTEITSAHTQKRKWRVAEDSKVIGQNQKEEREKKHEEKNLDKKKMKKKDYKTVTPKRPQRAHAKIKCIFTPFSFSIFYFILMRYICRCECVCFCAVLLFPIRSTMDMSVGVCVGSCLWYIDAFLKSRPNQLKQMQNPRIWSRFEQKQL